MKTWRIFLSACLLILASLCPAQSSPDALSPSEYRAELDRLLSATQQLDSSGSPTPQPLHVLPPSWHVRSDQQEFDVSTEGLQRDIRRYEKEKDVANAIAIRTRLLTLRSDLEGFLKPPRDVSANHRDLDSILSRPEFRDVSGPTWLERFTQWILELLGNILRRVFGSVAIPTISKFFIYGLMGIAILALAYFAYRSIWAGSRVETVVPRDLPVSAKEWAVWLSEARAAAAKNQWRDAIHLAYWAGISFLERSGMWKPDRARTPREYLRLLSTSSQHRETLTVLTRIFELAWYGKRGADEATFSQTLAALEKLGCR